MTASASLDGLALWLADAAPHESLDRFFSAFCHELVLRGWPLWRASLGLEVLHPEVSGWLHLWTDEAASVRESARAAVTTSPSYLNSPTRIVDETDQTFRRRLDQPSPDLPLLDELRADGATDYLMVPLPFLDKSRTAVLSFATREADGFSQADLDGLERCARLLSPYVERVVLRRIATDLMNTYVGPRAGSRIFEGRISRGQLERTEAAIWFADLRGFTRLAEEAPLDHVLGTLDTWFESLVAVIEAEGGEVLKFIGDAVLAIFPTGDGRTQTTACRHALAAAEAFCRRADAENAERMARGHAALDFVLALHVGEVAYGNVGAPRRLDFTVIGPAVNRASRLQEIGKRLGLWSVASEAFARCLDRPIVDLGRHDLRDLGPEQVFTLRASH